MTCLLCSSVQTHMRMLHTHKFEKQQDFSFANFQLIFQPCDSSFALLFSNCFNSIANQYESMPHVLDIEIYIMVRLYDFFNSCSNHTFPIHSQTIHSMYYIFLLLSVSVSLPSSLLSSPCLCLSRSFSVFLSPFLPPSLPPSFHL